MPRNDYTQARIDLTTDLERAYPNSITCKVTSINDDGTVNTKRDHDPDGVEFRNVPVANIKSGGGSRNPSGSKGLSVGAGVVQGFVDRDPQKPFVFGISKGMGSGEEAPVPEPPIPDPDPNTTCGSWPRLQGGKAYYKGEEEVCPPDVDQCANYSWDTDDITETNIGTPPTDYGIKLFRSYGQYLYQVVTPARTSFEEVDLADSGNVTDTVSMGGEIYSMAIDLENGGNIMVRSAYPGSGECADVPPSCDDKRRQGAEEGQIEGCKDGFADWELDRSGETGYQTTNYAPTCPYNPPANDDEECYCEGWDNGYEGGPGNEFLGYIGGYDECFSQAAEGYLTAEDEAANECFPVGETDCDGGGGPGFLANFDETHFGDCGGAPYDGETCLTNNGGDPFAAYICAFCYRYTTEGDSECCNQYRDGYEDSGDCTAPGSGCP